MKGSVFDNFGDSIQWKDLIESSDVILAGLRIRGRLMKLDRRSYRASPLPPSEPVTPRSRPSHRKHTHKRKLERILSTASPRPVVCSMN